MRWLTGSFLVVVSIAALSLGAGSHDTISGGRLGEEAPLGFPDCNENGTDDATDISSGTSADCDQNGRPDECDVAPGFSEESIPFQSAITDLGDLDGDGDLDAIVLGGWLENVDGLGTFVFNDVDTEGQGVARDLDGDGDLDLVGFFNNGLFSGVRWNENLDGAGNFGPEKILYQDHFDQDGPYPWIRLMVGDIDGDGDLDLFTVWQELAFYYLWLENDGTDSSWPVHDLGNIAASGQNPNDFDFLDMDGDADPDLVENRPGSAQNNFTDLKWYENDGAGGTWTPHAIQPGPPPPQFSYKFVVADLDGDDDPDVIIEAQDLDELRWYENEDGFGNFGPAQAITTGVILTGAALDVDADTDLDLVLTRWDLPSRQIVWIENTDGLGTFGPQQLIVSKDDLGPSGVTPGDFDRDGLVDFIGRWNVFMGPPHLFLYRNEKDDCNGNGVPDSCDLGSEPDCNANGVPDSCDVETGNYLDCNVNGVPDSCDVEMGNSTDLDRDGIPDECQADCDMDGVPDRFCSPGEVSPTSSQLLVTGHDRLNGEIRISYTPACGADDNTIRSGDLSQVNSYSYTASVCNTGNTGVTTWVYPAESSFVLIVARNGAVEGSYGTDSSGGERPQDPGSCILVQDLGNRCD